MMSMRAVLIRIRKPSVFFALVDENIIYTELLVKSQLKASAKLKVCVKLFSHIHSSWHSCTTTETLQNDSMYGIMSIGK